jgi:hypothetical protein
MLFPDCCGLDINLDIIIYLCLLHNQGGMFKIISTIGHALCVLLFMNGFMPFVLIVILIFLGLMINSGFHESMFQYCVTSIDCLIISASCLCFSLCYHNNFDSFFVCKPALQMRNDRKVAKHLFRSAFYSIAVLIINAIFSTIESVEFTNRAFLKVFILSPMI